RCAPRRAHAAGCSDRRDVRSIVSISGVGDMGSGNVAGVIEDPDRRLFGTTDEGFCIVELVSDENGQLADLVFREVNDAFERQTGLRDVVGRTLRELLPSL